MHSPLSSSLTPPARVHYLKAVDGGCLIPNGPNLCFPRFIVDKAEGLSLYRRWIDRLADAGGNFLRLWLGHSFFDLEPEACGRFSPDRAARLRAILDHAHGRGIHVKLTLDHFRFIRPESVAEIFPGAASFDKALYHVSRGGVATDMADYLGSPAGRAHFLSKLDFLAVEFAAHPAIFAWELWNEMNAVRADNWKEWTAFMLPQLRARFPKAYCLQSLGSFESGRQSGIYAWYCGLEENDIAQVHRYLDLAPGNDPVCRGPVDVMAASAILDLRALAPGKPVILAESGAVEPGHRAPFALYEKDHAGSILHDVLFAAFFAGAAGPGQIWHWDLYLDRNDLWHHYRAFSRTLEGVDPAAEGFVPHFRETGDWRIYELRGEWTSLFWIRDAHSDWRTELEQGRAPSLHRDRGFTPDIAIPGSEWASLDPWAADPVWKPCHPASNGAVPLPPWRRSLLLRRCHTGTELI